MNVRHAVLMLQSLGYSLSVQDGRIKWTFPSSEQPPEASILFEALRSNKAEAIQTIQQIASGFTEMPAGCGERREIRFENIDEASMKRWALALEAGLIALDGKISISRSTGIIHLRYRCTFPDEWLQEAITAASKRQYNALLGRIRAGEKWIRENPAHPAYERHYEGFLKLFEDLRLLYCAVNEPLQDPMDGYVGEGDRCVTG